MKTNAPVKKVLRSLRPYLPLLLAAVVSALISVSLTLYIPVLIGHAIDRIIGQGQVFFDDVAQILGYIGIAVGGVTVFQWLMQYFVNLVCYKTVRDLRRAVFRKLNTVPLSYIDTHAHGDLISRVINDVDAVGDGLAQLFLQLFAGIVTIVGTLIFMLMTDWRIALAVFFLTRPTGGSRWQCSSSRRCRSLWQALSASSAPSASASSSFCRARSPPM